jgi:hypothetical protein
MRKTALIALFLVSAVAAATGFILSRSARAMAVLVNVKDLPEHGLRVVGPADSSFNSLTATLPNVQSKAPPEALRPFSIFIKNTGKRTVVAYRLKWEVMHSDGKVLTYAQGHVIPGVLKGEEDVPGRRSGKKIRPDSVWYCSLATQPMEVASRESAADEPSGSGTSFAALHGSQYRDEAERAVRENDQGASLNILADELAQASSITVSLDGVIFDDGTFAGPDSTGFFGRVKAMLDAEHDLLTEMDLSLKEHKTPAAVFRHIEEVARGRAVQPRPDSPADEVYNYYKNRYAKKFLRAKGTLGDDQLIAGALQPLRKSWLKLRKQD